MCTVRRARKHEIDLDALTVVSNDGLVSVKCYKEIDEECVLVPRKNAWKGEPFSVACESVHLRENQQDVYTKIKNALVEKRTALASLYTGFGKTVLAVKLAIERDLSTLIVVHKLQLVTQWKNAFQAFAGVSLETYPNDGQFVVATVQSILRKKDVSRYKLIILDEVHHYSASSFSSIFFTETAEYVLGFSATIARTDGLHKVITNFLGDPVVRRDDLQIVPRVLRVTMRDYNIETRESWNPSKRALGLDYTHMISSLSSHEARNADIITMIRALNEQGRSVLALSKRRDQVLSLSRQLTEYGVKATPLLAGVKTHPTEDDKTIIATYAFAGEGTDLPWLNTVVFLNPVSDIRQVVGRVLRRKTDAVPLVVDLVDAFPCMQNQYRQRKKFYDLHKMEIQHCPVNATMFE